MIDEVLAWELQPKNITIDAWYASKKT